MLQRTVYSLVLLAIGAMIGADAVQAQGPGRGRGRGPGMGRGMGRNMGPMGPGSCRGQNMGPRAGQRNGDAESCPLPAASNQPLTAAEKEHLLGMREEEKLAHDVYVTLGKKWDVQVFKNIPFAEARHMDAIAQLLKRYNLSDPVTSTKVGEFHDPKFTALYQQLVATGSQSQTAAYQVGCLIEELDIADLQAAEKATDHADIQFVYENLERGSRNHLRAFASMLKIAGGTYQAKHLPQSEFDKIAQGNMERGGPAGSAARGRGPGMGRGRGMGRGFSGGWGQGGRGPGRNG